MTKLESSFYLNNDVVYLSRSLLGMHLCTNLGGLSSGIIVETEAYNGETDRASHAFGNRRTSRTEIMFGEGGQAYIYLCYGVHSLFNVVTNIKGIPHAILIRAIQPAKGLELMKKRRKKSKIDRSLCGGPGVLAQALGMNFKMTGTSLQSDRIWIAENGSTLQDSDIIASPRVGVGYAGEHAKLPWRFRIKDNPWVSPAK